MKLATWNVNSLKVRLPQVLDWLAKNQPDVLCLQEIKLENSRFPAAEIEECGYRAVANGQKTYNGVAILSKEQSVDALDAIPGFEDPQKRVLAVTIGKLRVICLYVPNGESLDSDKYAYKLKWFSACRNWLEHELARHPELVALGDYNVAPDERDVYDPKALEGGVLVSAPERAAFQELLNLGLRDAFRLFPQADKSYTWWDYRMMAFRRNMGLRIDHVLLSRALAPRCISCVIDRAQRKNERPSDHAPVIAEITRP